jgi:hypothetical protein
MSKWSSAFRDSRWQKKRLEIMERDEWTCRSCGATGEGVMLNVHHAYYETGKAPWEYPSDSLLTWCDQCHSERHEAMKDIMNGLANTTESVFYGLYGIMTAKTGLLSFIAESVLSPQTLCSVVVEAVKASERSARDE